MSTTDRRVARTKTALVRAMVELILEKGFEATNISEITARANVGRSTFYVHYADKDDLLQGALEGLRQHLKESIGAVGERRDERVHPALRFCLPMLEHAIENRQLFEAMLGRRSGNLLMELIHDIWTDLIRTAQPDADEITVQTIAGGLGATVSWWLTRAPELTPREVDRRFRATVEASLR